MEFFFFFPFLFLCYYQSYKAVPDASEKKVVFVMVFFLITGLPALVVSVILASRNQNEVYGKEQGDEL